MTYVSSHVNIPVLKLTNNSSWAAAPEPPLPHDPLQLGSQPAHNFVSGWSSYKRTQAHLFFLFRRRARLCVLGTQLDPADLFASTLPPSSCNLSVKGGFTPVCLHLLDPS